MVWTSTTVEPDDGGNGGGEGRAADGDGDAEAGGPGPVTRVDLVLEGGGVKGIGLVGAISVLEEYGYRFQRVAGTSAAP